MSDVYRLALIGLLVLGNAVFVAAEYALVTASRPRLQERAKAGKRGAKRALALMDTPVIFISTAIGALRERAEGEIDVYVKGRAIKPKTSGQEKYAEAMLKHAIREAVGTLRITRGEHVIDFDQPWPRVRLRDPSAKTSSVSPNSITVSCWLGDAAV